MNWDDLKKSVNSREMMLAAVFYLALLFMFLRIFYWPHQAELTLLSEKTQSMQLEKEALEKFASASQVHQQEQTIFTSKPSTPKMQILSGKNKALITTLPSLLNTITARDFIDSLVVDSMNQSPKVNQNGYSKSPLKLKAHGTFKNILTFLSKVDELKALVTIDALALFLEANQQSDVSLELTATLYQLEDVHEKVAPTKK